MAFTGSACRHETSGSAERCGWRCDGRVALAGSHPASGKKVLYWHDPMVPGQRFDKPGKSPFMDMQLVPVYADSGGKGRSRSLACSAESRDTYGGSATGDDGATFRRSAGSRSTIATSRWCRREPAASSSGCTCARRSIRCARASRWRSCRCRIGLLRRRSSCRQAHPRRGAASGLRRAGRRGAPAHAACRHVRRADRAVEASGTVGPRVRP